MAQQIALDSIKNEMHSTQNDTLQLLFMERIANEYAEINPDSAL